jgi:hypothetical protein
MVKAYQPVTQLEEENNSLGEEIMRLQANYGGGSCQK